MGPGAAAPHQKAVNVTELEGPGRDVNLDNAGFSARVRAREGHPRITPGFTHKRKRKEAGCYPAIREKSCSPGS
jgi:hypothetical protein